MRLFLFIFAAAAVLAAADGPLHEAELLFPLEAWHNHSSSIVELPNHDLLVCWFHGRGEREADDVKIEGARWSATRHAWGSRFTLADTPGFPDTNPVLFLDRKERLWLFWPAILANTWESALMKYKVSTVYQQADGPPHWTEGDNLLVIPKNLSQRIEQVLGGKNARPGAAERWHAQLQMQASDKLSSRLGWFTRTHPRTLPSGRILVPLYSDGFSMSLIAISDDDGATWTGSEPIVGYGNIQPSVLRRKDGTLVAYMRDNGPPPKRAHRAESKDDGMTWTAAEDTAIPNPGSSLEGAVLASGHWILVYNDTERDRHSLAVSISDDEGATWKWTRHLENQPDGSFHYPSVIQTHDGLVHVTYSYFVRPDGNQVKAIKHAAFNEAWVQQGDSAR
ncbi:MAG: sialidase family protein [Bryobacteraceae bacterium]